MQVFYSDTSLELPVLAETYMSSLASLEATCMIWMFEASVSCMYIFVFSCHIYVYI